MFPEKTLEKLREFGLIYMQVKVMYIVQISTYYIGLPTVRVQFSLVQAKPKKFSSWFGQKGVN